MHKTNNIASRLIAASLGLMVLQGCSGVIATAGSMAADAGLDHTLSGISYKTFSTSIDTMRAAAFNTLDRLDMEIADQVRKPNGWTIIAIARDRTIEIELEALTRQVTRMRVVAHEGGLFFKDASTATEIIIQTAQTLDMEHVDINGPEFGPAETATLHKEY
ncbi:MAG: DUF3568 family protein [Alphaproteobacteria bacterium]|jgi:hypothetical protein|nr:DUF3568 family protein [Alphaproteobacteria bacterium]MBT7942874.1 DUF3568 family protein [Alphaproteobacteria bacterium]